MRVVRGGDDVHLLQRGLLDRALGAGLERDATADAGRVAGLEEALRDRQIGAGAVCLDQAADAIHNLATAGLSADEILAGAARSTVLLANATGGDFGQAGTVATDATPDDPKDPTDQESGDVPPLPDPATPPPDDLPPIAPPPPPGDGDQQG